jgi:2'-5' RNA ligase
MSEALGPSARRLGTAVRAFFAVEPGEAAKLALAALVRELRGRPDGDAVRWVRPEGFHVTLRFLGNVPSTELPALAQAVLAALTGAPGFRVTLGAVRAFPSARQPRVVVAELEPEAELLALAERVEVGVVAAGRGPSPRRFRAHLTLGRVRGRRLPPLDLPAAGGEIDVHEVVLFRSDLGRDGSRYTPIANLPLAGSAPRAASLPLPTSL